MGQLVNSGVLTELRSLYPTLEMKALTTQQERLITLLLENATLSAAARGAGYSSNQTARDFLDTPQAVAILQYFSERSLELISVNRDRLNVMLFELYGERGNAAEGVRIVEALARVNGLNEEAKQRKVDINNITVNQQNNVTNNNLSNMDTEAIRKKMETMDASKLLEHASPRFQNFSLNPEDDALVVEVDKDQLDHEKEIHSNVEIDS